MRDHPRYEELFVKWAIRYLRNYKGFNVGKYLQDEVSASGRLLDKNGNVTPERLTYLVRNAREWIDDHIGVELLLSEGFIDITHDDERREELEELDVYPKKRQGYRI